MSTFTSTQSFNGSSRMGASLVATMDVRVIAGRVPDLPVAACCAVLPDPERPIDTAAWPVIFSALAGGGLQPPPPSGTVRAVIMRNAQQDAALARSFDSR